MQRPPVIPAARPANPAPGQPVAHGRKMRSKAMGEWQRIGREMGIIKKQANGKLYIPKKGTADYEKINAEFKKSKAKGY